MVLNEGVLLLLLSQLGLHRLVAALFDLVGPGQHRRLLQLAIIYLGWKEVGIRVCSLDEKLVQGLTIHILSLHVLYDLLRVHSGNCCSCFIVLKLLSALRGNDLGFTSCVE